MPCGFDKGLIAALYDGETTPAERLLVDRHLVTCSECVADLSSMRELSASLKPLKGASAPMSIAEGVMREIGSARRPRRPWMQWSLSAAAAGLLAIGTVYLLDRRASPVRDEGLARLEPPKSQASVPRTVENMSKKKALLESAEVDRRVAPSADGKVPMPADPPPAAPPAGEAAKPAVPPAEPEKHAEDEGRGVQLRDKEAPDAKKDESATALGKDYKKPVTPVLRITSGNPMVARADVEKFLKERAIKMTQSSTWPLGRSRVVRDRYLQLEMTEEELKSLEKWLGAQEGIEWTAGSFEDEKKRVADEEAKLKNTLGAQSDKEAVQEGEKPEEPEAPSPKTVPDRARGAIGGKAVERKKIILVFEAAPQKK